MGSAEKSVFMEAVVYLTTARTSAGALAKEKVAVLSPPAVRWAVTMTESRRMVGFWPVTSVSKRGPRGS